MKSVVRLLLVGIAACAFNACEKQPYSKIEALTGGHGAHDEHGQQEEHAAARPHDGEHAAPAAGH